MAPRSSQENPYYKKEESKTTYKKGLTKIVDVSEIEHKTQEKEWYVFVNSYLRLSKIGCEQLQSKKKKLTINKKYIVIAIIYNLKHSLEIILKAFSRTLNRDIDKGDQIHDIKKLFTSFKKKIKKNDKKLNKQVDSLEEIITKYIEFNFLNEYLRKCFVVNDIENTFFKYPENSVKITVDYEKLLNQITKDNIRNIETDIEKLIKIILSIKKLIR